MQLWAVRFSGTSGQGCWRKEDGASTTAMRISRPILTAIVTHLAERRKLRLDFLKARTRRLEKTFARNRRRYAARRSRQQTQAKRVPQAPGLSG